MFPFRRNRTKLSNFLDITEQNVVYRLTDDFQKSILWVEFFHRFLTSLELGCQKLSPPSGLAVLVSGRRVSARAQSGRAPFSNYEHHTFVSKKREVWCFFDTPPLKIWHILLVPHQKLCLRRCTIYLSFCNFFLIISHIFLIVSKIY